MRRLALAAALGCGAATLGCGAAQTPPAPRACAIDGAAPDSVGRIDCERDFALLAVARDDAVFAHTLTLNVLIDREDGSRLYFIHTGRFGLHYDFAVEYLDRPGLTPVGTHAEFNALNYARPGRRFVLAQAVKYEDQDLLTVQLAAGDNAPADMIADLISRVAEAMFDGDRLYFRPVSVEQEARAAELPGAVRVVSTDAVFSGQAYQPLNAGAGYGTLRFLRATQLGATPPAPTDVVVLDRVPNDIPTVGGIVTAEFQTPLSHVNVLARGRGTPNMALRGAFDDAELRALEGTLVRLDVAPQEFSVEPASLDDAQAWWDAIRPAEPLVPTADLSVDDLVDLAGDVAGAQPPGLDAAAYAGAKAANYAQLAAIEGVPTPGEAFAIPFSWYARHVAAAGLGADIDAVAKDYAAGDLAGEDLERALFAIRWAIFTAPMDAGDLARLVDRLRAGFGDARVRFRSSTNVEDLEEFSGAGLYTSVGASLEEGEGAIAAAVRTVWASAWNPSAFVERDFYRVDHRAVMMGVLANRAYPDERANGVALTINEFSERRPGFYINAQDGDVLVTNPTGLAVPEQLLYYTWYEEPQIEVIARSNLTGGAPVLDVETVDRLGTALEAVHARFRELYDPERRQREFAVDVEFKVDADGNLVLKQARPLKRAGEM